MNREYTEGNLVEQATCDILYRLKWEIIEAYKNEIFGKNGTLGRENKSEIILFKFLIPQLKKLNPGLPNVAYEKTFFKIKESFANKSAYNINKEKYFLIKNGVDVEFVDNNGENVIRKIKIFDFENPESNHFIAVRQLEVQGDLYLRRPDIIGFVNGIPLVFFELKSIHKDLRHAYDDNLKDYKDTIPNLFNTNAFVILSNGLQSKKGTITSPFKFFH